MEFEGNRTELEFVIFLILNSLSFSYISIYKLLIFKKNLSYKIYQYASHFGVI